MAKTADVEQSIWTDPWFLGLPTDSKLLYMWAITTDHGNLAGLFVVAQPVIQMETGLTATKFERALEPLAGKFHYRPASGAIWVTGRAKKVRSKTVQIAKSIVKAVAECPEPEYQHAFVEKYGSSAWLGEPLSNLALPSRSGEPHLNLTEVPSQSQSQSKSPEKVQPVARPRARVAGEPVTDEELELATRILEAFNETAGSGYELATWLTPIVGRIREKPDYTAAQHAAIIRANFKNPWWQDRPSPKVIYGNAAAFEAAIEKGRANRRSAPPRGNLARDLAGAA